jgi:hypothetical protein
MCEESQFPVVNVAVTLIVHDEKILVVWNPRWGAFSLPMSKRREWHDPRVPASHHGEDWLDAGARAAAEYLGQTCEPELLLDNIDEYQQSDRDGAWKRYHFQVFRISLADQPELVAGAIAEWLTPEEVLNRRPISLTARYLVGKLQEVKKL